MWRNTRRCSTTSVYFSTSPLAMPSCSLSSHPKNYFVGEERFHVVSLNLCLTWRLYKCPLIKQGRGVANSKFNDTRSDRDRSFFSSRCVPHVGVSGLDFLNYLDQQSAARISVTLWHKLFVVKRGDALCEYPNALSPPYFVHHESLDQIGDRL
jgi:hypothetical protein